MTSRRRFFHQITAGLVALGLWPRPARKVVAKCWGCGAPLWYSERVCCYWIEKLRDMREAYVCSRTLLLYRVEEVEAIIPHDVWRLDEGEAVMLDGRDVQEWAHECTVKSLREKGLIA